LSRPFTLIKKWRRRRKPSGQAKINELQQSLQETQQRLGELQQQKQDKDQRFILSPEQKAEVENFRKKQAEVSKELKQAQKGFAQGGRVAGDAAEVAQHSGHAAGRDAGGHRHCGGQTEKDFSQMNRKQFVILLVLVVVIGAAGLIVYQRNNNSWHGAARPSARSCCPICPSTTSRKSPSSPARTALDLARRDNLWRVRERAIIRRTFQQISDLLMKVADLKVVQNEEIGPSQLGRLELLPPGPARTRARPLNSRIKTANRSAHCCWAKST
jgi:hypothetical protein